MGKFKKKLKKVNREKSNKMIFAVAGGLGLLVAIGVFLVLWLDSTTTKADIINKAIKYLEVAEGISDIKVNADSNEISIVFDKFTQEDYIKKVFYAGLKVSNQLKNETITIRVIESQSKQIKETLIFKNGTLVSRKAEAKPEANHS
jgi:hypothetical protein